MDNILISIIVPAYNIEAYIGRCLDSILHQTHKLLEIIVVNDGSTDDTGKIIDEYATNDQRVIAVHKENGGVSSARLAGLEKVTGEYVGFVDGDDYIEPDMYGRLILNAVNYRAVISQCGNKMIFPDGYSEVHYGTGKLLLQSRQEALIDLLSGEFIEPGLGNKLFHVSLISVYKSSEIWDSNIRINEDLLMNYIFFKAADKVVFEDIPFYHYILRKGSAMTSKRKRNQITDPLKVICLIKQDCAKDDNLYPIVYCRYLRALINVAMQTEWIDDAENAKKILKKECLNEEFSEYCSSKKLQIMVFGVAWIRPVYKLIRAIYDKITGVSSKYVIE